MAPAGSQAARIINGAQQAHAQRKRGIETGSIERKPKLVAKPKAVAKPKSAVKPAPVGVLVATGSSVDSLRLNWTILNDRYADAMRNMKPRYIVNGSGGARNYALIVGPVASTAKAKSLCKNLTAKGLSCAVSKFRGNAL